MLKLYDYFRSSASFRVRIALEYKNLAYETIPVHLINHGGEQHAPSYQAINPQELVPSLEVDNQIITQSLAIIGYLEEAHPQPPLLPANPLGRALARSIALSIAADMHPLNNLRVLNYLSHDLKVSDEGKNAWYQHWMRLGLVSLERLLTDRKKSGTFCLGDTFTIADACLVPQLFNARRFNCKLDDLPTLVRIDANCQALAAVQRAWPKETESVK